MAQQSGPDARAIETHPHNSATDTLHQPSDLYSRVMAPVNSAAALSDPLKDAIANVSHMPAADLTPSARSTEAAQSPGAARALDAAVRPDANDGVGARNKLAQEALASNPAEMRRLFPQVLKDVNDSQPISQLPDHLNISRIEMGLNDSRLSELDRNYLTVLKDGYSVFSTSTSGKYRNYGLHSNIDTAGVSASSLAMIDKAVNRDIKEDPFFKNGLFENPANLGGSLAALAAYDTYRETHDGKETLICAGIGAIAGTVLGLATPFIYRWTGEEAMVYDEARKNYLTFTSAYHDRTTIQKKRTRSRLVNIFVIRNR